MKSFRSALATGKPQLGLCIMYPSPGVVERVGHDWDWIWIDGQHGQQAYPDLLAMVRACDLVDRPAFVRVPWHETGPIGLALDMGASGVIVPCVSTVEEARAVVHAAKFPPLGKRSYGGRRPIDRYGRMYANTANEDTLLVIQIETPEAVENADQLAALPGVDALFLGPDDIMLRRGYSMDTPRSKETLGKDMDAVINACRKHGKFGAMVGVGETMFKLSLATGFHLIIAGGDVPFLAESSKRASASARAWIEGANATAKKAEPGVASPY